MKYSPLPREYLRQVKQRARRFSGAYHGTAGSLAGDCLRLMESLAALEEASMTAAHLEKTRDADEQLAEGGAAHASADCGDECAAGCGLCGKSETDSDFILRAAKELEASRLPGDGIANSDAETLRPGSREVLRVFDEAAKLHLRKTLDYGADEDALRNIKEGADLINVPSWQACLIRLADKMSRMRAYCRRGRVEFDGVEDNLIDMVSYAAIALAEYRRESGHAQDGQKQPDG